MTTSPDYSTATNMAYEVLAQCKDFSLPIYVRDILKRYSDIRVLAYDEASLKYQLNQEILLERSEFGFTMVRCGKRIILYNEKKNLEIIRFTMAHELGHCVLEHISDDDNSNKEANCFARNLLCPIPIVRELQIEVVEDYMELFAVSKPMAAASMSFANYDFNLINEVLYSRMKDLLMCHMSRYSLAKLYGYPNVSQANSRQINGKAYQGNDRVEESAITYLNQGFSAFVAEEERELLDRLKFGE